MQYADGESAKIIIIIVVIIIVKNTHELRDAACFSFPIVNNERKFRLSPQSIMI